MRMCPRSVCSRSVIVAVLLLAASAQASLGLDCGDAPSYLERVEGVLLDAQGSALSDAEVIAIRKGNDFEASTTADQAGAFGFQRLPNGDYTLTARVDGEIVVKTKVRLLPRAAASDHTLRIQLASSSARCPAIEVVPIRQTRE